MKPQQYERVDIKSLKFDKRNARKHDKKNIKSIKDSLLKFGQQKPIVVTEDNTVIAGNGTLQAATELGWDTIDIHRSVLKGAEAKAYALVDNRSAELAEWEEQTLKESLAELEADGWDLEGLGWDSDDLKDILPSEGTEGLTDEDAVPEVEQNVFDVKLGDIWQLGSHRLMCGDSTDKATVEKLMNGEKADMVFTDPPYGMAYGGGRGKKNFGMIKGDDQDPTKFYDVLKYATEVYLWGRIENWDHLPSKPRDVIVWKKNNFGLGKGYRGQYEVCFYFGGFSGSDSDVWEVKKDTDYVHPTQKPVELCERAIKNSSPNNILDRFLGSGSTLIACEKTGRKCYGMELDPHYCSVIIKRWQDFTGKQAAKL
jgi:hypothetical protein